MTSAPPSPGPGRVRVPAPVSSGETWPMDLLRDRRDASVARTRILLLGDFPPSPWVGALRWSGMAAVLEEEGFTLDVLTEHPDDMERTEWARLDRVPPGTRVFGVRRRAPLLLRAWRRWRASRRPAAAATAPAAPVAPAAPGPGSAEALLVRRRDIRWWPPRRRDLQAARRLLAERWLYAPWLRDVARAADALAARERFDLVVSSGPPHALHAIAARLARRLRLPHVADLRDPWALEEYVVPANATALRFALAERAEAAIARSAALVTTTTQHLAEAMRRRYGLGADRCVAILNGLDHEPLAAGDDGGTFRIVHAGSLYLGRDPRPLLAACARVVRRLALGPGALRLDFYGDGDRVGERSLAELAADAGLADHLRFHGLLPREAAEREMAAAAVLVLFQPLEDSIPAKLFEYAGMPAWTLALSPAGGATDLALREAGEAAVDPGDVDAIAAWLEARYHAWRAGGRPRPLAARHDFSRRRQALRLAEHLRRLAPRAPGAGT